MNETKGEELCAWQPHCYESRVSGSEYCEDHLLQKQVRAVQAAPMGSLATLIRKARGKGILRPVSSYAG